MEETETKELCTGQHMLQGAGPVRSQSPCPWPQTQRPRAEHIAELAWSGRNLQQPPFLTSQSTAFYHQSFVIYMEKYENEI